MGIFKKKKDKEQNEEGIKVTEEKKEDIIYSVNRFKILEGKARIVPPLMWFYTVDNDYSKIANISLARINHSIEEEEWKNGNTIYEDLNHQFRYIVNNENDEIQINYTSINNDSDELDAERMIHKAKRLTLYHSFIDNCLNEDIYKECDFLEIYKFVLLNIYSSSEYCIDGMLSAESLKMAINAIHREYMRYRKNVCTDNFLKKFKCYKAITYLENNIFSIDKGNVMEGNLKILPEMKWIFLQNRTYPQIFQVDLAVTYKNNYNDLDEGYSTEFISLKDNVIYETNNNADELVHYYYPDIIGEDHTDFCFNFHENVLYGDKYKISDLKQILQNTTEEIGAFLNFNRNNQNTVDETIDYETDILTETQVKKLIKKSHRNYMDMKRGD